MITENVSVNLFTLFLEIQSLHDALYNQNGTAALLPVLTSFQSLIDPNFKKGVQQDASEFLLHLLDLICDKPDWGTSTQVFTCANCQEKSYSMAEKFLDFQLPIENSDRKCANLLESLRLFTIEEKMESQRECPKCNQKADYKKSMKVEKFPKVLILCKIFHFESLHSFIHLFIALNRFEYCMQSGQSKKITVPVNFPEESREIFEILKCDDAASDDTISYSLQAVVHHYGASLDRGHYTASIKTGTDSWHTFNDDSVNPVESHQFSVENSSPYILMYVRK